MAPIVLAARLATAFDSNPSGCLAVGLFDEIIEPADTLESGTEGNVRHRQIGLVYEFPGEMHSSG
jgi:hypothetical protein